jgi:hypothetical protein
MADERAAALLSIADLESPKIKVALVKKVALVF